MAEKSSSKSDQINPADVSAQLARTVEAFKLRFGRPPVAAAVAPGRVNLIGEHTDYNGGFVMPMAIERQTIVVADASTNDRTNVASTSLADEASFDPAAPVKGEPAWANYVKGVFAGFAEKGHPSPPLDIMIDSTVPLGGGLSSSAALEVATATLLEAATDHRLDNKDKALLAQKAEHDYAGMPCGIMDQFISVFGQPDHAMLLDCLAQEPTLVPLDDPSVAVLIINTNVKHELTGGEYAQRRAQCEEAAKALKVEYLRFTDQHELLKHKDNLDPLAFKRAYHVVGENERCRRAANLMAAGDWDGVGKLLYASHASLRDAFEVSVYELDLLVYLSSKITSYQGMYGCRMTGGGFGGCVVALVRADKAEGIAMRLTGEYLTETGIEPTAFVTRAADGARALEIPG